MLLIEVALTCSAVFDILLKMVNEGRVTNSFSAQDFFHSRWNIVDLVCLIVVVALLGVYCAFAYGTFGRREITVELETDDVISLSLIAVRFAVQTIRTAGTLKQ